MNILGYELSNNDKLDRAINGTVGRGGQLAGGVGDKASDEAKIAEYDRLGGLITKNGRKLKMGCFYDFAKRKPKETPEIVYVFRDLDGDEVEIPEGQEIPLEVQAAEVASKKKIKKVKKTIEDEE